MSLQATEKECAANATHPRVSLDDIKAAIMAEHYFTAGEASGPINPTNRRHRKGARRESASGASRRGPAGRPH